MQRQSIPIRCQWRNRPRDHQDSTAHRWSTRAAQSWAHASSPHGEDAHRAHSLLPTRKVSFRLAGNTQARNCRTRRRKIDDPISTRAFHNFVLGLGCTCAGEKRCAVPGTCRSKTSATRSGVKGYRQNETQAPDEQRFHQSTRQKLDRLRHRAKTPTAFEHDDSVGSKLTQKPVLGTPASIVPAQRLPPVGDWAQARSPHKFRL